MKHLSHHAADWLEGLLCETVSSCIELQDQAESCRFRDTLYHCDALAVAQISSNIRLMQFTGFLLVCSTVTEGQWKRPVSKTGSRTSRTANQIWCVLHICLLTLCIACIWRLDKHKQRQGKCADKIPYVLVAIIVSRETETA